MNIISVRYDVYGIQHVTLEDGREVVIHDCIVCRNDSVVFDPVLGEWRLEHEDN